MILSPNSPSRMARGGRALNPLGDRIPPTTGSTGLPCVRADGTGCAASRSFQDSRAANSRAIAMAAKKEETFTASTTVRGLSLTIFAALASTAIGPRRYRNDPWRVRSEIDNSDYRPHFVLLTRREVYCKVGDVAGFDADHLHPFIIREIRQRMRFLYPWIPNNSRG